MPHRPIQHRVRSRRFLLTLWCAVILSGACWSCAVKDNYKVLSFFFDGVPDPNQPGKGSGGVKVAVDIRNSPTYSAHQPFKTDACAECHSGSFQLSIQDSGICLKCHEATTREHARMHGPVAVAACLWCHSPHESAEAHLLKKPARQVCTQCHEPQMLVSGGVPGHADESRSCLECHFGHGGSAQFFLRPSAGGPPVEPKIPAASAPDPDLPVPQPSDPADPPQTPVPDPGAGAVP